MNRRKVAICATFFCLLIALGVYFHNLQYDKQASIRDIFKISRAVEQTAFDRIESLLVDYTIDNDIQKSIKHFLQSVDSCLDSSDILINSAEGPQEGQSGDSLFFIRDNKDHLKLVVKVFSKPFDVNGSFKRELDGLGLLSNAQGNNFHLIAIKAIGKSMINGEPYGIIALSPADGINMQTLLINIVRLPEESTERLNALYIAQKGVEKLGFALAEFHQIRTQKSMPLDATIFDRMKHDVSKVEKHLMQENIGIDISMLKNYVTYLVNQVRKIKTTRAIIHGDAHLGNFLYDADADVVYMVDYNQIGRSVDKDGNPIGNTAMDIMNVLDIIAANKQFGLTPQEIDTLIKAFIKGYGTLPSQLEQDFFLLFFRLGFLGWFLKAENDRPERFVESPLKKISDYLVQEVKHTLVHFSICAKE